MKEYEFKTCTECGEILPVPSDARFQCGARSLTEASDAAESNQPPSLPERIGPYEIIGKLGSGGMGVVYEAKQPALDRRVALKVMFGRFDHDPTYHQRFEREAKAAAVSHPNPVHVYDYGAADGYRHQRKHSLIRTGNHPSGSG